PPAATNTARPSTRTRTAPPPSEGLESAREGALEDGETGPKRTDPKTEGRSARSPGGGFHSCLNLSNLPEFHVMTVRRRRQDPKYPIRAGAFAGGKNQKSGKESAAGRGRRRRVR